MIDNVVPWNKLRASNDTSTSFTAKAITATAVAAGANNGIIELSNPGGQVKSILQLMPFGAGSDNQTFDMRIHGWSVIGSLYIPTPLAQLSCTLCARTGASGEAVADTDRLVDTITLATGYNSGVSVEYTSPGSATADSGGGLVQIDLKGFSLVEINFDMTGATNGNALYRVLG